MQPLQATLFGVADPAVDEGAPTERIQLDERSWIDVTRCWLHGADAICAELAENVEWRQGRRQMYERMLDDPRLSRWYGPDEPGPHPALPEVRAAIGRRYGCELGGVVLNYYRDGRDSVAPHRDRELRHLDDTLIAIVTLGAKRPFHVRPLAGGPSIDLSPASGDLVVMGGACQLGWMHAVPKVRRAGPRISASYRWSSGRGATPPPPARAPRRSARDTSSIPEGVTPPP